jgi:ubiquinone/menaquinone biosynthesis C-methylase UbiE
MTAFDGERNAMSHVQLVDALPEWRESAPYWAKHHATIRQMFAPLTRALVEDAGIIQGQAVLDIAGGAGEPSLTIAEIVGPTGTVTCTDAVAEMVEAARIEARDRGLTNVQFRQCTADDLPFPDNSFDVTISRLGAMFFPDPELAFREMLRVTKSGGSLGFVVWHKSEFNPYSRCLITLKFHRPILMPRTPFALLNQGSSLAYSEAPAPAIFVSGSLNLIAPRPYHLKSFGTCVRKSPKC